MLFRSGYASLLVFLALLQFFGDVDSIGYAKSNPWIIVGVGILYVGLGVIWTVFKWNLLCSRMANDYIQERTKFLQKYFTTDVPDNVPDSLKETWKNAVTYSGNSYSATGRRLDYSIDHRISGVAPSVKNYMDELSFWVAFWMLDLLKDFFGEFLANFWMVIVNSIKGWLQRISDNKYKGIKNDF